MSCMDISFSEQQLSSQNIELMWVLSSATLVSHASLLTARPSNPSKVLSAIRLWAGNCDFTGGLTKQELLLVSLLHSACVHVSSG